MRKILWLSLAVLLSILFFPAAALGDGYLEYSSLVTSGGSLFAAHRAQWLSLGGQYQNGRYTYGLRYAVSGALGQGTGDAITANLTGVFLGEQFLARTAMTLTGMTGYYYWRLSSSGATKERAWATSVALGFDFRWGKKPFGLDLACLYGVANTFGFDDGTSITAGDDPGFYDLGLECSFQIGAGSEIFLVCRDVSITNGKDDWGANGFGVGLRSRF